MKLHTRTRYGLRILLDIAEYSEHTPVTIRDTAHRQQISPKYVEKLCRELKKAGYLESRLGSRGGYMLACPPEQIRVGEVVVAMEGGFELVDCWLRGTTCPRHTDCLACSLWGRISTLIAESLQEVSLADLLRNSSKLRDAASEFREW